MILLVYKFFLKKHFHHHCCFGSSSYCSTSFPAADLSFVVLTILQLLLRCHSEQDTNPNKKTKKNNRLHFTKSPLDCSQNKSDSKGRDIQWAKKANNTTKLKVSPSFLMLFEALLWGHHGGVCSFTLLSGIHSGLSKRTIDQHRAAPLRLQSPILTSHEFVLSYS